VSNSPTIFEELDPEPRLLMGPGPVDVYPRVLRAMSTALQGQFDPQFTQYMDQVQVLYRQVFETTNRQTFLVNGTARAGIEACLASVIRPGDTVLAPIFGRFGHLLKEIAMRSGANAQSIETQWGNVFCADELESAIKKFKPAVVAISQGDTSVTVKQPLKELGEICKRHNCILYVDATASLGGNALPIDDWGIDIVSAGLQKCLSGPPGSSPISFNDEIASRVLNYFDLAMLMDYWGPDRLNHHTESASMLYAARECARILLEEGLVACQRRHQQTSGALRAGLKAMGLELFGDQEHLMDNVTGIYIPAACGNGAAVRSDMLNDFGIEIGTSFGPLDGKIWRIGTMGYVCRKSNVMRCLSSLEMVLRRHGFSAPQGEGVDAAYSYYESS